MKIVFKRIFFSFLIPIFSGLCGTWAYFHWAYKNQVSGVPSPSYGIYRNAAMEAQPDGFVKASAISTPCVVFIKNESTVEYGSGFSWFWDYDPFNSRGKATSTGSGVIVSKDGYIVTNNHVINGADKLTVVLNQQKREYSAKVIGADPSTDLALIKIEAKDLPAISFSNSDNLLVGDWVVAVGNPFNLTSTVTAGIVSAKGRNINIVQNQFPIESFIQTDAAINPGNSGGALVNTAGELVGINTAIQSNTGSYSGYGFAIPSNIVNKIVKDLIEYGEVKRAFPGITVIDISAEKADAIKLDKEGVIISDLLEDGPAAKAGVVAGDVILKLDGKPTPSKALFDEYLAYHRPGDIVKLSIWKNGSEKEISVKLIDKNNNTALMMKGAVSSKVLGADFQPLSPSELRKNGIENGIRILNIRRGGYINQMNLPDGFIILKFNGKTYSEAEDLISAMEAGKRQITIEGMNKDGMRQSFSFYTN